MEFSDGWSGTWKDGKATVSRLLKDPLSEGMEESEVSAMEELPMGTGGWRIADDLAKDSSAVDDSAKDGSVADDSDMEVMSTSMSEVWS